MSTGDLRPLAAALALRHALRRAGIAFVHWKSNDHLAEALRGETDIDMFVETSQRPQFETAMREFGALKIKSQPWSGYPDVEDWLVFDQATGRFLHIHQHFALMTGLKRVKHLRLPWGRTLMANLREDPASGWPIPAAAMELIILLVRIWAKMPPQRRLLAPRIPSHILRELDWLRKSTSEADLTRLLAELFPGLDPAAVLPVLRPGPLKAEEIISIARELYGRLSPHQRMPWPEALKLAVVQNMRMVLTRSLRLIRPETITGKTIPGGGLMIALLGSDGAGKSTVSRELHRWLGFKLDVHDYYMGSGDGGRRPADLVRRIIRAVVKSMKPARQEGSKESGPAASEKPHGFLRKSVELYHLLIMHHKVNLLRAARKLVAQGSVVLIDRYPQTQFHGISDGPKIQGGGSFDWAARCELALYAEASRLGPDAAVKLLVTPEVAHLRKPDHDIAVMTLKAEIVRLLSFPSASMIEVDATQPLDAVLVDAKRAIWNRLVAAQR